VAKVVR